MLSTPACPHRQSQTCPALWAWPAPGPACGLGPALWNSPLLQPPWSSCAMVASSPLARAEPRRNGLPFRCRLPGPCAALPGNALLARYHCLRVGSFSSLDRSAGGSDVRRRASGAATGGSRPDRQGRCGGAGAVDGGLAGSCRAVAAAQIAGHSGQGGGCSRARRRWRSNRRSAAEAGLNSATVWASASIHTFYSLPPEVVQHQKLP